MVLEAAGVAYQKAVRYCNFQERTAKEVQDKLYAWGVKNQTVVVHIIQTLKQNKFLDEERYVAAFIRGKYLGKKWGKVKLQDALTKKAIDPTLIQKELATLEKDHYLQSLRYLADRKSQLLGTASTTQKRKKLINYLLQKGYEPDLIIPIVQEVLK